MRKVVPSPVKWKANWGETRGRFERWWNREGVLLGAWAPPAAPQARHALAARPDEPGTPCERYCNPGFRAARNRYDLAHAHFPEDVLPIASTDLGPGSLALFCGSAPEFDDHTVWFNPCWDRLARLDDAGPLNFDPGNRWWITTEAIIRHAVAAAQGNYLVGCPDLVENLDVLFSLRGAENALVDMVEDSPAVEHRLREILSVWQEAYARIHEMIRLPDGSSAYGAFSLWGPGKTAKVQCDASAMFSPSLYRRLVVPTLTAQCNWLDYSMYHLDGTQALPHLDAILAIASLDAVEWTPEPAVESGGAECWYGLYRSILAAGKSVQLVGVKPKEVMPLLDAIGCDGIYLLMDWSRPGETEMVLQLARAMGAKPALVQGNHTGV